MHACAALSLCLFCSISSFLTRLASSPLFLLFYLVEERHVDSLLWLGEGGHAHLHYLFLFYSFISFATYLFFHFAYLHLISTSGRWEEGRPLSHLSSIIFSIFCLRLFLPLSVRRGGLRHTTSATFWHSFACMPACLSLIPRKEDTPPLCMGRHWNRRRQGLLWCTPLYTGNFYTCVLPLPGREKEKEGRRRRRRAGRHTSPAHHLFSCTHTSSLFPRLHMPCTSSACTLACTAHCYLPHASSLPACLHMHISSLSHACPLYQQQALGRAGWGRARIFGITHLLHLFSSCLPRAPSSSARIATLSASHALFHSFSLSLLRAHAWQA